MLRNNRPVLAFFDSIKTLRVRQLALILKAGYDPNLMLNSRGQNGLQYLIHYFNATDAHYRLRAPINKSAYLSIAKLLLDAALDPNAASDLLENETVLFDAIRYNDYEMVALLLDYVDVSVRNKSGETALMCAARHGTKQMVRLVLEHLQQLELDGYFLRQRNRFGRTALDIARAENLDAAKVLTKHLLTFGHITTSGLAPMARTHHRAQQLDGLAPVPMRASNLAARSSVAQVPRRDAALYAADYAGDAYLSASDYDVDGDTRAPLASYRAPFYDAKAAEFSQYLLEQQLEQSATSGGIRSTRRASSVRRQRTQSDDDDDIAAAASYRPAASGGLMRSRSCVLGPSASTGGCGGGAASPKAQSQKAWTKKGNDSTAAAAAHLSSSSSAGWPHESRRA